MTVSRKPRRPDAPSRPSRPPGEAVAGDSTVSAIIQRGGSSPASVDTPAGGPRKGILLKLGSQTLDDIAAALARRPVRLSRQTWIEEAIQEKLQRERNS